MPPELKDEVYSFMNCEMQRSLYNPHVRYSGTPGSPVLHVNKADVGAKLHRHDQWDSLSFDCLYAD